MAKSLLDATNEVLKRTGVIIGDTGVLTSLENPARQAFIDVAIQVINEGIDELYSTTSLPKPNQLAEGSIALAEGTRDYALAADLLRLHWPFIDKVNNQVIWEHPRGYLAMLREDPEQDDDGTPLRATIRPTDSRLFLDRAPTAQIDGRIYTYQYDKELVLTVAADEVPFNDAVFRGMVPAWAELWKRDYRKDFDLAMFRASIGRASRLLRQVPQRASWSPR